MTSILRCPIPSEFRAPVPAGLSLANKEFTTTTTTTILNYM